jgi:iron-sulfur cluster repair protein YtfE (RIC family)
MPYLLDFWDKYLRHHFEQEERTIFPLLPDDDSHLQQARTEHVHLRSLIKGLSSGNGADAREVLAVFAKDLEAHIRFEERILFPHIEHTVPEGWLSSVAVSAGGYAEDTNSWADAFWKA